MVVSLDLLTAAEIVGRAVPPLAVLGFDAAPPEGLPPGCARVRLPLPPIGNSAPARYETWGTAHPPERIEAAGLTLSRAGDVVFGALTLPDEAAPDALGQRAYEMIFAALTSSGCPHLLRVSHFLPHITHGTADGEERYRRFNVGRARAFAGRGGGWAREAPAASALGSTADHVVIHFAAAGTPPRAIENPRQVSAYRYPERYGAARPIFSRAVLAFERTAPTLLISGTASITGSETRHAGEPAGQADEIARNIAALLDECARVTGIALRVLPTKLYVRDPLDAPLVAGQLAAAGLAPAVILRADICRPDLLAELEAVAVPG